MKELSDSNAAERKRTPFLLVAHPVFLLLALAASILIGLRAKGVARVLAPAGSIYLLLLQMTVIPILISSMVSGIARLVERPGFVRMTARLVAAFVLVALVIALVGGAAGVFGSPGSKLGEQNQAALARIVSASPQSSDLSVSLSAPPHDRARSGLLDLVTRIVPRNVFASLAGGQILPIVLFSFLFGLAIGLLREKQQGLLMQVAEGTLRAFTTINMWLIYLLPLGIICLLSPQIGSMSESILLPMLRFVELFGGAALVCLVVTTLVVWARSGRGLLLVLRSLVEPSTYAFITGNSLISIPYALRTLSGRLGFRKESTYFVQPVLSVAGSYGNLLFFVLATIFLAQFYVSELSPAAYALLFASATLAAIGTTGRSGAGTVALLPLVLAPLGLPIDAALVIFGSLGLIIGPVLALVDVNAAMAAATLTMLRPAQLRQVEPSAVALPPKRRISIRASLVVLLGSLIVLTGGVMLGLLYSGEKRGLYILADKMVKGISDQVEQRTLNYFSPAERSNRRMKYLVESGLLAIDSQTGLLAALRDEVVNNPEFASAYFADPRGNFFMVKRMPDGSLSTRVIRRTDQNVIVHWQHGNPYYDSVFPDSVESLQTGYDPRSRGWYQAAAQTDSLIWTDVYLFASDNMLGISNAVSVHSPDGELKGVLAVDIGLAELSYFLGTLDVSREGTAFILNNKSEIIALSTRRGDDLSALFAGPRAQGATAPANLVLADASENSTVRASYLAHLRTEEKSSFFTFRADDTTYLSTYSAFPENRYFNWTIAIAIPEAQIMGEINRTNTIVLYAAILIILVSIGIGINFSRAITFPLGRLSREMERIRNFDLLGDEEIGSRIREIHTMTQSFLNMKQGLRAFNKYVPSKLVAQLLELGQEPRLGGQSKELTILFSDIKGFTSISERLPPHRLVDELAIYFTTLSNIIMKNGGTVDKYIGDAIMAFWNAPADSPNHAEAACRAAIAMNRALHDLRHTDRGDTSIFETTTRLGIHTGEAIVGNMGSSERLNYTVIGDNVNLASRLEGLNKYYGTEIIVSDSTLSGAHGSVVARLLDRVAVKGRTAGIEIYELVGLVDEIDAPTLEFVRTAT
ncbi:cation:dicarboxylate symporter family transporter, partial [Salinispira pacifica]